MLLSFKNETRESPDLWGNKVCTNHRIFVLSLIFGLKLVNIWVLVGQDNVKPHCHTHIWKPWAFLTLTRWCPFDLQLPQSLNLLICAHLEIAQSGKKGCSHKLYCDPETRWQSIHALSRGIQSGILWTCLRLKWLLLPKSTRTPTPDTFSCHFFHISSSSSWTAE